MPTVHVTPGADQLLQDIANALHKAKKVVVVTGAGISTNSGIPDFRSENGLYSLIQAQFDAASRELEKRAEERDIRSSPPIMDDPPARPSKRRKLSLGNESEPMRREERRTMEVASQDESRDESQQSPRGAQPLAGDDDQKISGDEDACITVDDPLSIRAYITVDDTLSITVDDPLSITVDDPLSITVDDPLSITVAESEESQDSTIYCDVAMVDSTLVVPGAESDCPPISEGGAMMSSAPGVTPTSHASPSLLPQQPEDALGCDNQPQPPTNPTSSSRSSTPIFSLLSSDIDQSAPHPLTSSPLSSPPPILSDPYRELSLERTYSRSESGSQAEGSSTAESDEDTDNSEEASGSSTPYLTSQSSFNSSHSRTTLPNLKGRDLFDASIWADPIKTSVFYTFATTLRQKSRDVTPTTSHRFLGVLRDQRKLVRCYTQNIDQLEDRVGLSTSLDLGAGSRARFSAKAWRSTGAAGSQNQQPSQQGEGSPPAGQGNGKADEEPQAAATTPQQTERGSRKRRRGEEEDGGQMGQGRSVSPGRRQSQGKGHLRGGGLGPPATTTSAATAAAGQGPNLTSPPATRPGSPGQQIEVPQGQRADDQDRQEEEGGEQPLSGPSEPSVPPLPSSQPPTFSAPNTGVECVFLHGSLDSLRCFLCGQTSSWDDAERELETLAGRQPTCPHCAGATAAREERGKRALGVGKLRPNIVLYGEEHPRSDLIGTIVQHDLSLGPDMLLILGTSLRVHGLKTVVREFAKAVHSKGGKVVFVNFTKPPDSVWSDVIDFWVQSDCDAWVSDVKTRKPVLWLPPGSSADEDENKPSRAKRTSIGATNSLRRASSGLSVTSDKEPAKAAKAKRKSTGDSVKLRRMDSGLSRIEEVVSVSTPAGSKITTPDNSSPSSSPVVLHIPDSSTAEEGNTTTKLVSLPAPVRALDGIDNKENTYQATAKKTRRSLPTGTGKREVKLNPNAKRPQSIRDETQNGAHLTWKILEDLKRMTGQPKPTFLYSTAPPLEPKVARPKKSRMSAPAGYLPCPLPMEMATPLPSQEAPLAFLQRPRHSEARLLPFDPAAELSPAMTLPRVETPVPLPFFAMPSQLAEISASQIPSMPRSQPAVASPFGQSLPVLRPVQSNERSGRPQAGFFPRQFPAFPSPPDAISGSPEVNAETSEVPPQEQPKGKGARTTKRKTKKATVPRPLLVKKDPSQPAIVRLAAAPSILGPLPSSITAAVKNRKRKRKTIDGVEVELPAAGRRMMNRPPRPSLPLPSPHLQTYVPQTPSREAVVLQGFTPQSAAPQSPWLILPLPTLSPKAPRFTGPVEQPVVPTDWEPPALRDVPPEDLAAAKLEAMQPELTMGPLPTSAGPHKLADFFLHRPKSLFRPFETPSVKPFGFHDPFSIRTPLSSQCSGFPYQGTPIVSRCNSPGPSEQLRSEEAELALSMLKNGVSPVKAKEYLEDRRLVDHRRVQHAHSRTASMLDDVRLMLDHQPQDRLHYHCDEWLSEVSGHIDSPFHDARIDVAQHGGT